MLRADSFGHVLYRLSVACVVAAALDAGGHGREARADAALNLHVGQSRMIRLDKPVVSVFVADPATADVQVVASRVLFVFGKAAGRTSLAVLASDGALVARWSVTVALDVGPVRSALAEDPEFRDLEVHPWRQGVELRGAVASSEAADRALQLVKAALPEKAVVVNRMSVSISQQVNLEVQIAEVQRSVSESLGINWEAFSTSPEGVLGFRVGRLIVGDRPPGALLPEGQAAVLSGSLRRPKGSVSGLIDALASAGLATVLARPNMTAVSGETASFFSGGEYPLPVGVDENRISFAFKKYGVLLDFVPTVIDSRRISLSVRPEVSQRVATDSLRILGTEIPVIDVRRAETTIEVGNGESIVIAGLYRNQGDSIDGGVPVLKDVPGVGALFGQRTARSSSTELIVVVTARLVAPTRARAERRKSGLTGLRAEGYHY